MLNEISQPQKNKYHMGFPIQGNFHAKNKINRYKGRCEYAYIHLEELYNDD